MALTWDKVTWFPNGTNQGFLLGIGAAAGDVTVSGIGTDDQIASVYAVEFGAGVPSAVHGLTSEFTITAADTINNVGGTSTANMLVLVQVVLGYRTGDNYTM